MQNCKLLIFNSDELKTIQCRSDDPASFVLHITDFDQSLIDGALHARLEWHEISCHSSRACSAPSISDWSKSVICNTKDAGSSLRHCMVFSSSELNINSLQFCICHASRSIMCPMSFNNFFSISFRLSLFCFCCSSCLCFSLGSIFLPSDLSVSSTDLDFSSL